MGESKNVMAINAMNATGIYVPPLFRVLSREKLSPELEHHKLVKKIGELISKYY